MTAPCPFKVGDFVRFTPSERTRSHYPDIESFGVRIGETKPIMEIQDGYLYFEGGAGGWPWTEFTKVE